MNSKNGNKAPKIRFPEFTDDWEQCKVSDITTSYSGGTPQAGNAEYYNGDIPFIRSGEIYGDHTELFITQKGMDNSSAKMVSKGDILYALYGATSGEVSRAGLDGAINQAILAIIPNENYNADFIVEWFRKEKANIIDKYLQGGQGNLSAQIIKNLDISIPSCEEQNMIGDFFSDINNLITLHQCKLDRMKEYKKGMLQKMFPKEGEAVPEIRFPGFTDDWEQRKLAELTDRIIVGLATSVTPFYRESGVPLLRNMNIKENYLDDSDILYLEEEYANANQSKMIHEKDVLTVHTGSNIGLTCIAPKQYEGSLSFTTLITTPSSGKLDSIFLMQYMNSSLGRKGIEAIITAGGKPNLNSGDLEKLLISYPKVDEQKKMGEFFSNLDNLITLHQRKCDKYKELKKCLLQQMFI